MSVLKSKLPKSKSSCPQPTVNNKHSFCIFHFCFLACLFLALSACDETFQPLQDNERHSFSIYGYLDASADTQWVRVTPVREQLEQSTIKPQMEVTLNHLQNEGTTVMNDSLFQFPDGFHILNAWTTTDIEPGQTYRLQAERPDGGASSVTVTTPDDFPMPRMEGSRCNVKLVIEGVERLVDVQYRWHVRISRPGLVFETLWTVPFRDRISRDSSGEFSVWISIPLARDRVAERLETFSDNITVQVLDSHIFVAAAGPEWIGNEEIESLDDLEYALPEIFSNVEGGTGFVVGIVSKTIPDDQCP